MVVWGLKMWSVHFQASLVAKLLKTSARTSSGLSHRAGPAVGVLSGGAGRPAKGRRPGLRGVRRGWRGLRGPSAASPTWSRRPGRAGHRGAQAEGFKRREVGGAEPGGHDQRQGLSVQGGHFRLRCEPMQWTCSSPSFRMESSTCPWLSPLLLENTALTRGPLDWLRWSARGCRCGSCAARIARGRTGRGWLRRISYGCRSSNS